MAQKVHIDSLYECPVNVLGAVASGESSANDFLAKDNVKAAVPSNRHAHRKIRTTAADRRKNAALRGKTGGRRGGRGHRVRHSLGGGVFVIAVSDVWESSGGGEGMEEDESICRSDGVRIRRNDQITPPTN
ncbi:hypothetical protein niasHS_005415 [Heterodera schachtii]|uniref:Uncharacterized protein n=1 Tax=Heterodera schachtii TaxID=97005 RepID=A0ABD2J988_HETSC